MRRRTWGWSGGITLVLIVDPGASGAMFSRREGIGVTGEDMNVLVGAIAWGRGGLFSLSRVERQTVMPLHAFFDGFWMKNKIRVNVFLRQCY